VPLSNEDENSRNESDDDEIYGIYDNKLHDQESSHNESDNNNLPVTLEPRKKRQYPV
jgi:hypothetical protein